MPRRRVIGAFRVSLTLILLLASVRSAKAQTGYNFVPVTPCRLADTRNVTGVFGGPSLSGGSSRSFPILSGSCGIPSNAAAYALNVTVVPGGTLGYITMWPTGQSQPVVSTLNSLDGRVKANSAIVPAGTGGAISVFASDATNIILDIDGYFVPTTVSSALAFYPLTPCRVADTRNASGALGGPSLVGSQTRSFPVLSSSCGLPSNAQAYSLNFTAIPKGPLGYLSVWPAGQSQPVVSTLNAPTGTVTANAAIVPAGTSGAIDLYATNSTDMVIDVNGYFAPPGIGGLSLYTLTPCRALDTRQGNVQPFSGALNVNVTGFGCTVPSTAQAYVFNATVVPPGALGYLTLWPQGAAQPLVSTLNALDGSVTSNMAIVPTTNGSISAFAANPTQLILDISGYFAPGTSGVSGQCANIAGNWSVSESGSYTETITASDGETGSSTNPISGGGSVAITQTGCSIQYDPIGESGLIGTNLTPSELASLTRTGTVSGNNVSVTGLLALINIVGSGQAGYTVTSVSSNILTAAGQVTGNVITLNETGSLVASGTYLISGQSGTFTETITTSSTATFALGSNAIITTVAGNGTPGFAGDGEAATSAELFNPGSVAVDASGDLFIADTNNNRIRKVSANGIITTVVGNGTAGFVGDGGAATSAELHFPEGVAVDASGDLFISDTYNHRVRKVSTSGIITTVAGNGTPGFAGDGEAATSAELYYPGGIAVDASGNLFIADTNNNRIRKVSASGIITTVAGNGTPGFAGDGEAATSAELHYPGGVAVDSSDDLFVADSENNRVRKVSASGIITTVAGKGIEGFSGDGGTATLAELYYPEGVAVDSSGDLFIVDSENNRIREVSTGGIITTVAGNGTGSFSGDGGPAILSELYLPNGAAVDGSGNLFIADASNQRIRMVAPAGAAAVASITSAEQIGVRFMGFAGSTMVAQ